MTEITKQDIIDLIEVAIYTECDTIAKMQELVKLLRNSTIKGE